MTTIHFADFILWLTNLSQGKDMRRGGGRVAGSLERRTGGRVPAVRYDWCSATGSNGGTPGRVPVSRGDEHGFYE